MTISRWEPFKDLMTLREAMDRLFEDSFVRPGTRWTPAEGVRLSLPLDVYATDEEIVVSAAIPGVEPDDVEITIEGNNLSIKGNVSGPLDNVDYVLQERSYGTFSRNLRLNIPVDTDKAEATFDKGVLTLTIPKKDAVKPRTVKVLSQK
jgi:HSP20 family protein